MRGIIRGLAVFGAGALILYGVQTCDQAHAQAITGPASVIDGDTIAVAGTRIRLWGIDAPEYNQTCGVYRAGELASAELRRIIGNRPVSCVTKDGDKYRRPISLCRNADNYDIGRALVATGHALAYTRYTDVYLGDQLAAQAKNLGMHAYNCISPESWRHSHGTGQQPTPKR